MIDKDFLIDFFDLLQKDEMKKNPEISLAYFDFNI